MEYRLQGHTLKAIAATMKVSEPRVHQLIKAGIANIKAENAQEVKALELERLDMLMAAHMAAAAQGDLNSGKMVLGIMERRATLIGLNGPIKHELTGKDGKPVEVESKVTPESARETLFEQLQKAGLAVLVPAAEEKQAEPSPKG
jgi:hypothetical protein